MLRSYTYENQLVGMPFSCSAIMLYYNCDMFREVGLDPNTPPTTIAEMADDISKLMVKDGDTVTRYGLPKPARRFRLRASSGRWTNSSATTRAAAPLP